MKWRCGIGYCFNLALVPWLALPVMTRGAEDVSSPRSISQEVEIEFGYVGESTTRRGGGPDIGSVDEINHGLRYVFSPQLSPHLFFHAGAEWRRLAFGRPDGALLPDELDRISAVIGVDWQATDEWLLRAEVLPGIYSDLHDVSWRDVDVPLLIGAVYLARTDLQWMFGLRVVPRSEYPVLPAAGVRWKFAAEWTLNLVLPEPRLEYELNDRLKAYVGADLKAGTFTLGDRFGNDAGHSELNRVVLDYTEVRTGFGVSWNVRPNLSLDASAGCMVYRRFEFVDQDLNARSSPAPYVQIGFHWQF